MKRSTSAVLLVLVIFVLLVALNFAFFVDPQTAQETEQTGNRSSYRTTPYGTRAFYTLLEEAGYPVTRLEKPYNEITDRDDIGTLVLIACPTTPAPTKRNLMPSPNGSARANNSSSSIKRFNSTASWATL